MKRRGGLIGLSILLATVTVGSILYTPSINRLTAIPAHARIIYSKQSPDNLRSVFPNLGSHSMAAGNSFPNIGKGDDFSTRGAALQRSWFQTLEAYPLTVATVPFGGRDRRDTWVAVSTLGSPAALALRWRMTLFAPAGISPARPYAVWPVWKVEHPSLPSWMKVRFAITEGLLICSVSSDSHDIYRLLDVADGRAASLAHQ